MLTPEVIEVHIYFPHTQLTQFSYLSSQPTATEEKKGENWGYKLCVYGKYENEDK